MSATEEPDVHLEDLEDLARTAWGELPAPLAERRQDDAVVDCGWGRLVFGQTFTDPTHIADVLRAEEPGSRDICLYEIAADYGARLGIREGGGGTLCLDVRVGLNAWLKNRVRE